jgi:hypothetical protein
LCALVGIVKKCFDTFLSSSCCVPDCVSGTKAGT